MNLNCYLKVTEKYLQQGIQGENLNPMLLYSNLKGIITMPSIGNFNWEKYAYQK